MLQTAQKQAFYCCIGVVQSLSSQELLLFNRGGSLNLNEAQVLFFSMQGHYLHYDCK